MDMVVVRDDCRVNSVADGCFICIMIVVEGKHILRVPDTLYILLKRCMKYCTVMWFVGKRVISVGLTPPTQPKIKQKSSQTKLIL